MTCEVAIVVAVLAFAFGFAAQRGSVCGVLAARQIVETGRYSRLKAFISASICALAVAVPLAWIFPDHFILSQSFSGVTIAMLGGGVYGLGTVINGACVFGTASRALSGNLSFVAALPGIAGGTVFATIMQFAHLQVVSSASPMQKPSFAGGVLVVAAVLLAGWSLYDLTRSGVRAKIGVQELLRASRWRTSIAMFVMGILGGALFTGGNAWAYPSLMRQLGHAVAGLPWNLPLVTVVGPIALLAGGLVSVRLGGRFAMRRFEPFQMARSLSGGATMGMASTLVPGGNDVMLLADLPSLGLHAAVAYPAMLATQIGLLYGVRTWRFRRP